MVESARFLERASPRPASSFGPEQLQAQCGRFRREARNLGFHGRPPKFSVLLFNSNIQGHLHTWACRVPPAPAVHAQRYGPGLPSAARRSSSGGV